MYIYWITPVLVNRFLVAILLALVLVLPGCSPTNFSNFRYQDHAIYNIHGRIDSRTYWGFDAFGNRPDIRKDPIIVIDLNSRGGEMMNADRIIDKIHNLQGQGKTVITYVADDAECMSACTMIFAAGTYRIAGDTSVWMFHAPWIIKPGIDLNKLGLPADRVKDYKDELIRSKEAMLVIYASVDPVFAEWLNNNYLSKPGTEYRVTGAELHDKSDPYITQLV